MKKYKQFLFLTMVSCLIGSAVFAQSYPGLSYNPGDVNITNNSSSPIDPLLGCMNSPGTNNDYSTIAPGQSRYATAKELQNLQCSLNIFFQLSWTPTLMPVCDVLSAPYSTSGGAMTIQVLDNTPFCNYIYGRSK